MNKIKSPPPDFKLTFKNFRELSRKSLQFMEGSWPLWSALLFFDIIMQSVNLGLMFMAKPLIDNAFGRKNLQDFVLITGAGAGLFLISKTAEIFNYFSKIKFSNRLTFKIDRAFLNHYFALPLENHQKYSTGEYHYFYRTYVISLVSFFNEQLITLISMIFQTAAIFIIVLWIKWPLVVIAVLLLPFYFLHNSAFRKKLVELYEKNDAFGRKYSNVIFNNFNYFLINKSKGMAHQRKRETLVSEGKRMRLDFDINRAVTLRSETRNLLDRIIIGTISLYGSLAIILGRLTLGSFSVIMLYFSRLINIWDRWHNFGQKLERNLFSIRKFFEILEIPKEPPEPKGALELKKIQGGFQINNIIFQYPERPVLLASVNLEIKPGQWVGLVGASGSGKTTLLQLLLRLRQPGSGQILLDGNDLNDIKINSLRHKTGLAFQDVYLYNDTIKNNLLFFQRGAADEKLFEEALEIAGVNEFLRDCPEGVDMSLGENSAKISQGQKQRISLARAIYGQPPLLMLDEALSSVDLKMEHEIYRKLRNYRKGRTTLVVTHRLTSVTDADLILFFHQNRIFSGTHQELMNQPDYHDFFTVAKIIA